MARAGTGTPAARAGGQARGIPAERVHKVHEARPNAIDLLVSGDIQLLINTPLGKLTQQLQELEAEVAEKENRWLELSELVD